MGYDYVTASASIYVGNGVLKSVVVTPLATGAACAQVTLYNATAATANTEMLWMHCGTAAQSIPWTCETGIEFDNLYVAVNCAYATVVWD